MIVPDGLKSRTTCPPTRTASYAILDLELDTTCTSGLMLCCAGSTAHVPVYKHQEVPLFMRHNPFVLYGYRSTLPFSLCVKSLFAWTNDTINIWSHLFGFFLFFSVMIWDLFLFSHDNPHITLLDRIMLTAGLLCYQFCMLCSTGYHLFRCHSEKAHLRWLALDLTGISVGLLGCYLPAIHLAFYCISVWRDVYLLMIGCLFAAVFIWQARPRLYTSRWLRVRQLIYIALTAYGVIPALHWVYLNGFTSTIVQLFAPKICVVYLLAGLAFAFYVSQFPERCFPGKFDYLGSSHQCWHIVVVVLFLFWHQAGRELLQYRVSHPCHVT